MTAETKAALEAAYAEFEAYVAEGHNASHTIDWLRDKCAALKADNETIDGIHAPLSDEHATKEEKPDLGSSPEEHLSIHRKALESRPDLPPMPWQEELPDTEVLEESHEGSAS
jgi:hypothetical protein